METLEQVITEAIDVGYRRLILKTGNTDQIAKAVRNWMAKEGYKKVEHLAEEIVAAMLDTPLFKPTIKDK